MQRSFPSAIFQSLKASRSVWQSFLRAPARIWRCIPFPRLRTCSMVGMCLVMMWGFDHPAFRAEGARVRKPRAWFDAKGFCVFPLADGPLPKSRQELNDSLNGGWHKALEHLADDDSVVFSDGEHFPYLSSLKMQLSSGRMDVTKDNKGSKPNGRVQGQIDVKDFELDGSPLLCDRAKLNLHLTANRARLDVERNERGEPVLMLADAKNARLDFQATRADLERIALVSARAAAKKYGVSVEKIDFKLEGDSLSHSLFLDMHISTKVGFIPAGMRFQAHVEIDDQMNAKLTNLKCDGDEALGPLIVGIIRPGLEKYEGRSKPIFSFPTGQLKLRDIRITSGEELKLAATFGG